jgi:hypothetical protein
MKKWYQSKAVWLGIFVLILSILSFLQGEAWIQEYPTAVTVIGTVVGVLTIVIRFLTGTTMKLTDKIKQKTRNLNSGS